jgi:type VI secretion system protein ImpK
MDLVSDLTSECFSAIGRLRALDEPVASPEAVHARLRAFVDTFKERARKAGVPEKDTQDIAYALVALVDEVALRAPEPLRGYWMNQPLQLHYFHENVAGEGFFSRLESLLADGRRLTVLCVYQLCLLFGFQGKYGFPGGEMELMRISESVRNQVQRNRGKRPTSRWFAAQTATCFSGCRSGSLRWPSRSSWACGFHSIGRLGTCRAAWTR